MKIELLSITKSPHLSSEEETANILAESFRRAKEFHNCTISVVKVERPPEGSLPFRRFKYDIIIEGNISENITLSLKECVAYTHFTVDGKMYQTSLYASVINILNQF